MDENADLLVAQSKRHRLKHYAQERGLAAILKKIVKALGIEDKTLANYYTLVKNNVEIRYQDVSVHVYVKINSREKRLVFSGNEQDTETFHRGEWESIFLLENRANEIGKVRDLRNTLAEIKKIADNFSNGASHDADND